MKWLRTLLGMCIHKMNIIERHELVNGDKKLPYAVCVVLQCEKCGNLKKMMVP